MDNATSVVVAVRQPKAAAIAGLAFGLILGGVLVLLQSAAPASVAESGTWMTDLDRRDAVSTALALIPFAGIAFLWFIAVVRSSLGRREDRFFDAVFTGSGLVFVAMLFAAAAVFTLAVSTSGLRAGSLPRLLALLGYGTGTLLLLTPPLPQWAQLLFPLWVMAISVHVLLRERSTT